MIKKLIPVLGFVIITSVFFWQFLFKGLLPIPADTIVGLYHPYRDIYSSTDSGGIPFKNFLITDPVRQQYPWRNLSINSFKNLDLPIWNPYSFSGTPNLANFQSGVFYPFNFIFFIISFEYAWSILIILQPLMAGIFLYFYLRNLKLDEYSSFFGGIVFAFSGFFVTWLEWGTVLSTALWLPLILLSIDKIIFYGGRNEKISFLKFKLSKLILWCLVLIFSSTTSFFAGHLQTFFYLFIFSVIYFVLRIWKLKNKIKIISLFLTSSVLIFIISLPQLLPTLKFILLSGREVDQFVWQKDGWFIPVQHLVQFVIPDFFGNPSTLNYWGIWNYGELTGFVGIVALIFSIYAAIFRRDKKTFLLILAIILCLILAISNPISKIPFIFNFPFISTAQPTRLLFIVDFALSILAALGLNYFIYKGRFREIIFPIGIIGSIFILFFLSLKLGIIPNVDIHNINVATRNIYFPAMIFILLTFIILLYPLVKNKFKPYFLILLILLTVAELFRFSWKFNTFSKSAYLYPENLTIHYLKKNVGDFRIATNDSRIMAPNFFIMHNLQSIEGYDPLYLERYAEFISAINRNSPDIAPPFGFNRILRIENFSSNLIDLLGVKYVLSISDINSPGYKKVFESGQTQVFENEDVLPRVFFVREVKLAKNKNEAIKLMFDKEFDPRNQAVVEEGETTNSSMGNAKIIKYSENEIIVETVNNGPGFLVLTDSFYPSWHVKINGVEKRIIITDFNFRGVFVPAGKNEIIFENKIL